MDELKQIVKGFYNKDHFLKRFIMVLVAVIIMGFCLSFLLLVNWGTDSCTMMSKAISTTVGLSIGNWQAIFNTILLILVIVFGGRNIGFGTIINMFLVGYSIDLFTGIWNKVLPLEMFDLLWVKIVVFIPALIVFVIAAAVYMTVDMGTAPFDAIIFTISEHIKKVPFMYLRIIYDALAVTIGLIFGGKLQIVTVLMVVMLGPIISFIGVRINKFIER